MKFNEKLKMLREERNMSLSEFATILGTSKQVLSRYERGENTPKITTVMNYAKILNVSLAFLTNDEVTERHFGKDIKITSSNDNMDEDEKMLISLFRCVPEDKKELILAMIRAALNTK